MLENETETVFYSVKIVDVLTRTGKKILVFYCHLYAS